MAKYLGLFLTCFFLSCAGLNIASSGTGSETDTGCVIEGLVRYSDSAAVIHAGVILHDQSSIAKTTLGKRLAAPALVRSGSTYTNINGFYRFDSVDTGNYLVEINDHDSLGAVLPVQINRSDTLKHVNGVLKRLGSIIGKIDTLGIGALRNAVIILPEIGRIIDVDSAGNFTITDLPAWNYQMRLAIRDSIVRLPRDTIPIPVKANDTTQVVRFGAKTGNIIIDGEIVE